MVATLIYIMLGVVEVIIGLRFVLLMIGANPASPFVAWVYGWSNPLVAPFSGIFGQHAATAGPGVAATSVFDWTALVALLIYGLIAAVLGHLARRPVAYHH
jgi:hypothetical protein